MPDIPLRCQFEGRSKIYFFPLTRVRQINRHNTELVDDIVYIIIHNHIHGINILQCPDLVYISRHLEGNRIIRVDSSKRFGVE
jgi:hypothetical protein